jgi:hypothetical protein
MHDYLAGGLLLALPATYFMLDDAKVIALLMPTPWRRIHHSQCASRWEML